MDLLQQLVGTLAAVALPQGNTLEALRPGEDGRIDVLASHVLAGAVVSLENPFVAVLFQAARPVIDGALVASLGPAAIQSGLAAMVKREPVKKVRTRKPTSVARRTKKKEYTTKGIEILDAEFVDIIEDRKR